MRMSETLRLASARVGDVVMSLTSSVEPFPLETSNFPCAMIFF